MYYLATFGIEKDGERGTDKFLFLEYGTLDDAWKKAQEREGKKGEKGITFLRLYEIEKLELGLICGQVHKYNHLFPEQFSSK
jgi:hypothetical protein